MSPDPDIEFPDDPLSGRDVFGCPSAWQCFHESCYGLGWECDYDGGICGRRQMANRLDATQVGVETGTQIPVSPSR